MEKNTLRPPRIILGLWLVFGSHLLWERAMSIITTVFAIVTFVIVMGFALSMIKELFKK